MIALLLNHLDLTEGDRMRELAQVVTRPTPVGWEVSIPSKLREKIHSMPW